MSTRFGGPLPDISTLLENPTTLKHNCVELLTNLVVDEAAIDAHSDRASVAQVLSTTPFQIAWTNGVLGTPLSKDTLLAAMTVAAAKTASGRHPWFNPCVLRVDIQYLRFPALCRYLDWTEFTTVAHAPAITQPPILSGAPEVVPVVTPLPTCAAHAVTTSLVDPSVAEAAADALDFQLGCV